MRLLDSNLVIYATQSHYAYLLPLLHASDCYISEITKLEVLGYHGFDTITKQNMHDLFETLQIIPINSAIIDKAIEIRQLRKMAIGDSIIAATALLNRCELLTRNVTDFKSLGLIVSNPM
jgi:toxin FitB